jgi:kynureninase
MGSSNISPLHAFPFENTLAFAQAMDSADQLHSFRARFHIPQHENQDCIYFTGNSLGLQPKSVRAYVNEELDDWARLGVEGHFQARRPWLSYHELFPQQMSALLGCLPEEVVVMNQLTVNLHLLMVTFYKPEGKRYKILCEAKAFPSDQYALESQVRYHGYDPQDAIIEVGPQEGGELIRHEDIIKAIEAHGDELALVLFGGVNYYTGQLFDMESITAAAHAKGVVVGFDLAHAIGNVSLALHDWQVDFATWCSYKYLNAGPGGVSGIYVHQRYVADTGLQRFAGWWGHNKERRFRMEKGFDAIPTAEGWQLSNAPVLSMAALKASLDIFAEAGMDRLISKSKKMSAYLRYILEDIDARAAKRVIRIITPADESERGCQVSMLMLQNGKDIFNELSKKGFVADWREPDVIRVAPVPLYNRFEDIWQFGSILEQAIIKCCH